MSHVTQGRRGGSPKRSAAWKIKSPRAAMEIFDSIERAVSMLEDHPKLARAGRIDGTRELVVIGTALIIVYRIKAETIQILRVIRGAQDWPPTSG